VACVCAFPRLLFVVGAFVADFAWVCCTAWRGGAGLCPQPGVQVLHAQVRITETSECVRCIFWFWIGSALCSTDEVRHCGFTSRMKGMIVRPFLPWLFSFLSKHNQNRLTKEQRSIIKILGRRSRGFRLSGRVHSLCKCIFERSSYPTKQTIMLVSQLHII